MMFDESNPQQMVQIAGTIGQLVPTIFRSSLKFDTISCDLQVSMAHKMKPSDVAPYLSLIDSTIGSLYIAVVGDNWKTEKIREMLEIGLIYVSYYSQELIGFISFMLVLEQGEKKLYLYEIHVNPKYQRLSLGSMLITNFHKLANVLNDSGNPLLSCTGTSLTVFANNSNAIQWYKKLGYTIAQHSPQDTFLRSRVLRPDYYIMSRPSQ